MPEVMDPDAAQPACFAGGPPYLVVEPVGRDVAVGVPDSRAARLVLAVGAASGAVGGVGSAAMLAPAACRVVSGQCAMPVSPAFSFGSVSPGGGAVAMLRVLVADCCGAW